VGTEGAAGLSTTAIETCIVGWADETQDGDEIPAARVELAALQAAAQANAIQYGQLQYQRERNQGLRDALADEVGRVRALTAACTLPDIDRALADLGVATTPTIVPDERRRAAVETVRTFLRVLRTVVAAVDAGGGAAGARDEIADLAVAFVRARDGAGTTVDDPATDVADVDAAVVAYVGALDALADAVQRLDALRAGGAGETGG
jgi:hypothetical protein